MLCDHCKRLLLPDEKEIERFWVRVDRSGGPDACWPLMARTNHNGYGVFSLGGREVRAHRAAFFFSHGHWPEPLGCHSCDTRPCCNPAHIFEGTLRDNMMDMRAKGRAGGLKLDEERVREIRRRYAAGGVTQAALASEYGVRRVHVGHIVRGTYWAEV